jgi:hypothetical protein
MLFRGLAVWLFVSAVFLALDVAGVADGLALPVPLIVALVVARVLEHADWARRHPRRLAVGTAAGCFAVAVLTWIFQVQWVDLTPLEFTITALAAGTLIGLLAFPGPRGLLLSPLGLDPARSVHAVVAVTLALTVLTAILLFVSLKDEPPATRPWPWPAWASCSPGIFAPPSIVSICVRFDCGTPAGRWPRRPGSIWW